MSLPHIHFSTEQFHKSLTQCFAGIMEIIDDPIVINMLPQIAVSEIMPNYQAFLIQQIEIKGIKRKESLFNSKECILQVTVGQKRMCRFTLQLFHYSPRKEAYIYDLGIPVMIAPLQAYQLSTEGILNDLIIILHGQRARPLA